MVLHPGLILVHSASYTILEEIDGMSLQAACRKCISMRYLVRALLHTQYVIVANVQGCKIAPSSWISPRCRKAACANTMGMSELGSKPRTKTRRLDYHSGGKRTQICPSCIMIERLHPVTHLGNHVNQYLS